MKIIKYFFEFIFIISFFFIFKIIGYKNASNLGEIIGKKIGPLFRSKSKILNNLKSSDVGNSEKDREDIIKNMWGNYGRILSEYIFLKNFRDNSLSTFLEIEGSDILAQIKRRNEQVVFISGHFNNFELMAMEIEKSGIDICAIYRPLNNIFLNFVIEKLRKKHICKNQIRKGKSGTRNLIDLFKKNFSVALMIDQRVSEGESIEFFNKKAKTTNYNFKMSFQNPIKFDDNSSIKEISLKLNKILEKMILNKPEQWIWTHDRWK